VPILDSFDLIRSDDEDSHEAGSVRDARCCHCRRLVHGSGRLPYLTLEIAVVMRKGENRRARQAVRAAMKRVAQRVT